MKRTLAMLLAVGALTGCASSAEQIDTQADYELQTKQIREITHSLTNGTEVTCLIYLGPSGIAMDCLEPKS